MPKLTNICLLLAILSLCARLSLGCTTRPTIEHSTRPTWSPCFPDCEKGFQCYQPTNQPGLAWVVKPAVFVWQLVPNYEIFHNFQFRICVPVTKREYESPNLSTKIKQTLHHLQPIQPFSLFHKSVDVPKLIAVNLLK